MGVITTDMISRITRVFPKLTNSLTTKTSSPAFFFSNDAVTQRGRDAENMYFRKKNEKKVKALMAKIQSQLEDGLDDINVDDLLEDREWLSSKLKQHGVNDEALVKDLLAWKHGSY